jgi:hypothetical protein
MMGLIKILLVGAILVAGYFMVKSLIPKPPGGYDDSYKVTIEPPPPISDSMKITNNSGMNLRLHMFNANDAARVVARENFVLQRGQSLGYPRGRYAFRVWKSQIVDEPILSTDEVWTDVVFTGAEGNLKVEGGPKPPVTIAHDVDEVLKVCAYNEKDAAQGIPLNCWTIGKDRVMEWRDGPPRFVLKLFKPELGDKVLTMETDVQERSVIRISKE